jgi:hypothetical protein
MSRRKGKGAAAAPEHGLYYKTPVTPEEVFQAIGASASKPGTRSTG